MARTPRTEPYNAPLPAQYAPKRIERQGGVTIPMVRRYPQVKGGVCEYCGILDKHVPSEFQYRMCPHYRGMTLECSYCPQDKEQEQVVGHAILNVYDHPNNPNELIVVCNSYECTRRHQQRFKV